jgi:hypothetical protein
MTGAQPGVLASVRRQGGFGVVELDGGEVLAAAGGESTYFLQPGERHREVRVKPR